MAKKERKNKTKKRKQKKRGGLTAANADRHELYENSVQAVDAEIDFVDQTFKELRGRKAHYLREDFCGTANSACEWVRRRKTNHAVGVDLDSAVTAWGYAKHVQSLRPQQRSRIELLNQDVSTVDTGAQDVVLAMNFSYWIFKQRADLRRYFEKVRATLVSDGVFFLDCYGGYEAFQVLKEHTRYADYTYTWHQARYNPVSGDLLCHIHFKFDDGSRLKKAFTYDWRLWTLPELREILYEAGFATATAYWQDWDEDDDEALGEFTPVESADADAGWICYLVAAC